MFNRELTAQAYRLHLFIYEASAKEINVKSDFENLILLKGG